MTLSRKTSLYRAGSPSIRQRNRILHQVQRYASIVDALAIALVKTQGSSLKPNEWTLTLTADEVKLAKPYEQLNIADGPNGEVVLKVSIPEDLREQIEAFEKELSITSVGAPVIPVQPIVEA